MFTVFLSFIAKTLPEYSITRNPDAEAICDLAMYNYIEVCVQLFSGKGTFLSIFYSRFTC